MLSKIMLNSKKDNLENGFLKPEYPFKLQLKGKHEEDNTSKKVSSEVYLGSNSKLFRGIIIWIENFLVGHVIDVCD